jgi:predicted lipoprotein with Yx(FWY)xxD motif
MKSRVKLGMGLAAATVSLASVAMGVGASSASAAAGRPKVLTAGVISLKEGKWGNVLADRGHFTLYLLSNESGLHFHCTKANGCWSFWKPLLITKGTKISKGSGVAGHVGAVSINSTEDQVYFNSYPVYTFVGDSGPAQQNGEGLKSYGGTWYMLNPKATTASSTPVK